MERVAVPLRLMGAQIRTDSGHPPVQIQPAAQLRAIHYELPVASAQVKSAILLAALGAHGRTRIAEPAPSRDHTERMLAAFGAELLHEGSTIALEGGQRLRGTQVAVPADFSSAAFFIVAGCLAATEPLVITNVGVNPTRTGLLELLQRMGADIRLHRRPASGPPGAEPVADIEVRASTLHGIEVPEALVPLAIDEFPVFFIAAACAGGETVVRGAHELRVKESDRLAATAAGLAVLGVEHELLPDGLRLRGAAAFAGGRIDSRGDHRIAMAFAIAALKARAPLEIEDVANVATSFPGFVGTARASGLQIQEL
jgi:prephenate dehydrogenase/3-phosphoshikimate 1-carboxyvinyltransferase